MNEKLLDALHKAMSQYGAIKPNWKISVASIENTNGSDWATVNVNIFRPRCRKPYTVWALAVYMPRDQIWWDKSTFVNL
ncbi:hypothetical protein [Acutalibacter muris]|uniref:hypothetical protein n=1 Tax=Acutalibacter muris TaxID=1796620 RepID=UPI00272AF629|nr:hypothetical protein [Acutalibacter muris]